MPFLDNVLQPPMYGWQDADGNLVKPANREILREFFSRLNVIKDRRNWLSFFSWFKVICLIPFLVVFVIYFLSWWTVVAALVYGIIMAIHGSVWYNRYCTHRAFEFAHPFWRFFTKNLTLDLIPEEIYVISDHVHHAKADRPGDPHNAQGGFLYCFLSDVIHQPIARNMTEADYFDVKLLMKHTGIPGNNYLQYQKWGSYVNPVFAIASWLLNWAFWYSVFYLIGGNALACTLFGAAGLWAICSRMFNYEAHGRGINKQCKGKDFGVADKSLNQLLPGIIAGEWHNNHHLYPKSARCGFQPNQVDPAWRYIKLMYRLGAVSGYKDDKRRFYEKYYRPYLEEHARYLNEIKQKEILGPFVPLRKDDTFNTKTW